MDYLRKLEICNFNPNYIFWEEMIESFKYLEGNINDKNILDFGCATGEFLHLFDSQYPVNRAIGIDIDSEKIKKSVETQKINFFDAETFDYKKYDEYFDCIFSQEVLYTLHDLNKHAKLIKKILKPKSFYIATMGCHIENPLWSHRREIIAKEEKYPVNDYSIDHVASVFFKAGFRVSIKRMDLSGFITYDPIETREFSNSLTELVNSTMNHKYIFMFYLPPEKYLLNNNSGLYH